MATRSFNRRRRPARSRAYQPFAPLSLAGHARQTETVLFYTRGEEEPAEIVRETGPYSFTLSLDDGNPDVKRRPSVTLVRELGWYDPRLQRRHAPMFAKDWRSATGR